MIKIVQNVDFLKCSVRPFIVVMKDELTPALTYGLAGTVVTASCCDNRSH